MARHVLIGVGGSGQHVVLAYLRLLALTVPGSDAVPHVFVLDADADEGKNPNKRSHLIDDIFALHAAMTQGDPNPPRCATLKPYRHESATGKVLLGRLVGDSDAAKRLAHGFLADDESDWGNDWSIELDRGMMANPKVGAIALAHKVMGARDADDEFGGARLALDPQIATLFACLGNNVRVAIAGSSFGGTGSGAIPALLRVLDKKAIDRARAFMTLPWFSIEQSGDRGRESSAAAARDGLDPQERNASLGLHTYWDSLTSLRAERGGAGLQRSSYVLAQSMERWKRAARKNQGNFDQEEHPHVLNLAVAGAIQAFFGLGEQTVAAQRGILYALKSTTQSELIGQFDARSSPHLRFWSGVDDSRQLADIAADAEATALVLERGGRVLAAAKNGKLTHPAVSDSLEVWSGMLAFVEALRGATGANTVDRSSTLGKLFRSPTRLMPEDKVFHTLGNALLGAADALRQSLVWLDRHAVTAAGADQAGAVGVKGLHGGHLFRARSTNDFRLGTEAVDDETALGLVWKSLSVRAVNPQGQAVPDSPVGAQAFLTFVLLFKNDEADDSLVAQFGRALAANPECDKPGLAAHVLAMAAHRRVMALRQGRITAERQDDQQRRDDDQTDGSVSPMLSLRVAADRARDVRLARIDLTKPLTGDDLPGPFDANHPRSLKYLDPYTEFAGEHADGFSFKEAAFPEHGLRAVPNLVAPVLLQRWRLRYCMPETEAEQREPLRQVDSKGNRRASKRGIHLHARRVNEAAFWLMVSADQRVEAVPDLLADADDSGAFAALVRLGLKEEGIAALPALVFAGKYAETIGRLPVFLWVGDTWVLAANRQARRFFARLVAELPSVRHCYSPDAPMVRARQPHGDAATSLDRFFHEELVRVAGHASALGDAASVGPLIGVLEQIVEELPAPAPRATGPLEPGASATAAAVADAQQGFTLAPVLELPITARQGQASLTVHAPAVLRQLGSYLLGSAHSPPLVVTPRLAANTTGELRLDAAAGLLPVRGEIWGDLDADGHSMLVRKTAPKTPGRPELARCKVLDLKLNLKGLGVKELALPFGEGALRLVEREVDWSFSVWPAFQATGWNYYVVSAICDGGQAVDDEPVRWSKPRIDLVFVVYGHPPGQTSGPLRELARVERGLPVRIVGVPVAIELRSGHQVLGSQPVRLRQVAAQGRAIERIGVDFGTSNTCVAFQPSGQAGGQPRTEMVRLLSGSEQGIAFSASAQDTDVARAIFLAETGNFFQARSALAASDEAAITIPSELLAGLHDNQNFSRDDQRPALPRIYRDGGKAWVEVASQGVAEGLPLASPLFSPLPNLRRGLADSAKVIQWLASMAKAGEDRIFGNLKWERTGDGGLEESRQLRALYLEHVLVAAFATLRESGYDRFKTFVATQPEARTGINDHFPNSYASDLQRIIERLCATTGFTWASEGRAEPDIVSETAAALLMYHLESEDQPHSALTIDIGGGTTDVGVLLNAPGAAPRAGENDGRRFTASARFAGNELLSAVVELPEFKKGLSKEAGGDAGLSVEARAAMLKAQLRNGFAIVQSERVQALAEMFFDAAFEYALRVLTLFAETRSGWLEGFEASPANQRLKVKLLGNGFKLFGKFRMGAAPSDRDLDAFLKARLARAVEAGMLPKSLAARFDFELEPNSKNELVSVGAFNAVRLHQDRFKPGQTDVLVPGGLVTATPKPDAKPVAHAQRVDVETFGREWLARPLGGGAPTQGLKLLLDAEVVQRLFPLTSRYWGSPEKALERIRSVFLSYPGVAEQYLDVGALYLTGVSDMKNPSCFAVLMRQQVDTWSK